MISSKKATYERDIFKLFVVAAKLPIDINSIESRSPPEPDILCMHNIEGLIAFELVEICDAKIAESISRLDESYIRTCSPTKEIMDKKFSKDYTTPHPIELLCYTNARVIDPDDMIISSINLSLCGSDNKYFRRIWLFGKDDKCHLVLEK